jgi:methionine synthase II (cobalamin-independent)
MPIPTEPIGSIPRPPELIEAVGRLSSGSISQAEVDALYNSALKDTIKRFEATGSPVITDGEQTKPSFATYPIDKLGNLSPDGIVIPFADGHQRQLPKLTAGPFRYTTHAESYLKEAQRYTRMPVKQAVISASALSLLYPSEGIVNYPRETFIDDLIDEAEADIRGCLNGGAHAVQIDFTEGRLSLKLDPSRQILKDFIDLNNRILDRFSVDERSRIGVHTCPGGDQDSTHSADVNYSELLPGLFGLKVGRIYLQLASETDRVETLEIVKELVQPDQVIFVGVTDPINPRVETPEEVRDRILEAAEFIPLAQLGSTDDCGFSPFGDDTSTSRETAFEKIRARVVGNAMASQKLGV